MSYLSIPLLMDIPSLETKTPSLILWGHRHTDAKIGQAYYQKRRT